eukprot:14875444-Alexandrium_andersonii.AAC.1
MLLEALGEDGLEFSKQLVHALRVLGSGRCGELLVHGFVGCIEAVLGALHDRAGYATAAQSEDHLGHLPPRLSVHRRLQCREPGLVAL